MKTFVLSIAIVSSSLFCSSTFAQGQVKDSLGLPGDNLNLYGVLDIFQQSKTLEEFEGKLNAQDSKLNNLDLNGDNKIDYIKVVDNVQGTSHAIVLKDEINEKEMQDVAVIEVDKDAEGKIKVQIVGDESLYGKNYIVEPKDVKANDSKSGETPNPGYAGQTTVINNTTNNYYDNDNYYSNNNFGNDGYYYGGHHVVYYPMNSWYMWDFLFAPTYVVYVSPWHWGYYPHYWNPWAPMYWHEYYGHHYHRYGYFERGYTYRAPIANGFYGPRRSVSITVNQRRQTGSFNTTYGRRDMLNKTINERRDAPGNNNRNQRKTEGARQNRGEMKNNPSRENENKPRRENNVNENKPRNENTQQRNNQPRQENKVNRQENNSRPAARPTRTERKAERATNRGASKSSGDGGKKR